jgi:hypothetical protein
MRAAGAHVGFLIAGVAMLVLGAILMIAMVFAPLAARDDNPALSTTTTESLATAATDNEPSRMWAVAGGLSLALGAGLIGIGLNSWRAGRPRTTQVRS